MKYNQEIIDWFNNYFDNCYYVKHEDYPESIFMFYDVNYVRQLKLAKLEGKDYMEKTNITGVCLFEQDWKYKWFRCDYSLILIYLRDNYSFNFTDFKLFIRNRLEEHSKMNILTPNHRLLSLSKRLEEHSKMNILTPHHLTISTIKTLEEHSKMNILTPFIQSFNYRGKLEEHTKMSVLTPDTHLRTTQNDLEEHSKLSILTPTIDKYREDVMQKEHSKMNMVLFKRYLFI